MECIEYSKGFCPSRQGEVLSQEIIDNPDMVEDRHFCKWKLGKECTVEASTKVRRDKANRQLKLRQTAVDNPYKLRHVHPVPDRDANTETT